MYAKCPTIMCGSEVHLWVLDLPMCTSNKTHIHTHKTVTPVVTYVIPRSQCMDIEC